MEVEQNKIIDDVFRTIPSSVAADLQKNKPPHHNTHMVMVTTYIPVKWYVILSYYGALDIGVAKFVRRVILTHVLFIINQMTHTSVARRK